MTMTLWTKTRPARSVARILAVAAMAVLGLAGAIAQDAFKPATHGGLIPQTHIFTVTNLKSSGAGSFRAALAEPSPKVILFEVGGIIGLDEDLSVDKPFTTIAGESAPGPGIVLVGGGLRIRSHDIVVRHIGIRPGSSSDPSVNESRDGLSIGGNPERYGAAIRNILIENVSVSWGVDENVSVWDEHTGNVQLRSMFIAEGLRNGGHPKGSHSMGMLVGSDIDLVTITDSLFANNNDRHPRVSPGAQVSAERNVVYNPGNEATQVFVDCTRGQLPMSFIDNVLIPGPETRRNLELYDFQSEERKPIQFGDPSCSTAWHTVTLSLADKARAAAIFGAVLTHAGSRPVDRDPVDLRILAELNSNTGSQKDQGETFSLPSSGQRIFEMPEDPDAMAANGATALANALCAAHLALGGLAYEGCV